MDPDDRPAPRTFPLEPHGPERSPQRFELLAQAGGTVVGAIVDDAFRTWLVGPGGYLTLVVWPSGFSARLYGLQFELLDEQGQLVAKGGELIKIGGAALVKDGDPRRLGHEDAFITSAQGVSRAPATAH